MTWTNSARAFVLVALLQLVVRVQAATVSLNRYWKDANGNGILDASEFVGNDTLNFRVSPIMEMFPLPNNGGWRMEVYRGSPVTKFGQTSDRSFTSSSTTNLVPVTFAVDLTSLQSAGISGLNLNQGLAVTSVVTVAPTGFVFTAVTDWNWIQHFYKFVPVKLNAADPVPTKTIQVDGIARFTGNLANGDFTVNLYAGSRIDSGKEYLVTFYNADPTAGRGEMWTLPPSNPPAMSFKQFTHSPFTPLEVMNYVVKRRYTGQAAYTQIASGMISKGTAVNVYDMESAQIVDNSDTLGPVANPDTAVTGGTSTTGGTTNTSTSGLAGGTTGGTTGGTSGGGTTTVNQTGGTTNVTTSGNITIQAPDVNVDLHTYEDTKNALKDAFGDAGTPTLPAGIPADDGSADTQLTGISDLATAGANGVAAVKDSVGNLMNLTTAAGNMTVTVPVIAPGAWDWKIPLAISGTTFNVDLAPYAGWISWLRGIMKFLVLYLVWRATVRLLAAIFHAAP